MRFRQAPRPQAPRHMRIGRTVLACVAVVSLASCGTVRAVPPSDAGSPTGKEDRSSNAALRRSKVPAECPGQKKLTPPGSDQKKLAPLPDDFHPSKVLLCEVTMAPEGEQGWQLEAQRGDDGLRPLIKQLRRPSAAGKGDSQPCTLELVVVPWFALVNASGEAFRPKIPTDSCGKPRDEALQALRDMKLKKVRSVSIKQ